MSNDMRDWLNFLKGLAIFLFVILVTALIVAWVFVKPATAWHPIVPVIVATTPTAPAVPVAPSGGGATVGGGGGAALSGGAVITAGFIGGVAVAAAICGANQPKRNWRRDTWYDTKHDVYPNYRNARATGCIVRKAPRDPNTVVARW